MVWPNFFTSGFVPFAAASLPASMSTVFAVTTMEAVGAIARDVVESGRREPEADHAHHDRSREREPRIALDPVRPEPGQPAVFADPRRDAVLPERAERHPCLERAKAPPELQAVVHVV